MNLTAEEKKTLRNLDVGKLYVRYFDIDRQEGFDGPGPIAQLHFQDPDTAFFSSIDIVPTIYITTRALKSLQETEVDSLTDRMWRLIQSLHKDGLNTPLREIQLDCDWTSTTRGAYFRILERLRTHISPQNILLSSTIRLHQIKFRKRTGIPPADRGMLMFYNMGRLDHPEEENSILDLSTGRDYLGKFKPYPIPLDAALPIFSWGVLIRERRPIKVIHGMELPATGPGTRFEKSRRNRVKVRESHYFRGHYVYPGDVIRLENVTEDALTEAAKLLAATLE
ncbi:MAG: hypothetical protein AAF570_16055, partial [Bacteroidota bacterium]